MNAFATIVEVVEVAALIVLVIYLIRILRDRDGSEPRSAIVDKNLAEIADFNRVIVGNPDIARIWQDGREDRRLNDIDQERFSLLAKDFLAMLANQRQRAAESVDQTLVEAATLKLIDTLQLNPGLLPEWEEIAAEVASGELREAVNKAMNPVEPEEPEELAVAVEPAATEPSEQSDDVAATPVSTVTAVAEENGRMATAEPVTAETQEIAQESTAKSSAESSTESSAEESESTQHSETEDSADSQVAATEPAGEDSESESRDREQSSPIAKAVAKQGAKKQDDANLDAVPAEAS
ncbi:MAG: hypothetical protein R3F41_10855 [Gammaproteobacteria bacterium]|nr:hypothetical protein [Pseudomonadales bacterium]MCP5348108.1 hypothetical protein [Pseudomonadales bacterium]